MKTTLMQFNKGINVIGDKTLMAPGWATIEDNVDLRSGQPRPITAPQYLNAAPAGTTRIYSYRGNWYYNSVYCDYVSTLLNGVQRVMYSQYGGAPQKIIEGTQVPLGLPVPANPPTAIASANLVPVLTITQAVGGDILKGTIRTYRVAAETVDGIMPASSALAGTASVDATAFTLTWTAVNGAYKYHIFAGNGNNESEIATLASGTLTYTDAGNSSGSGGGTASSYDNNNPLTYFYTFERTVNTVTDESGPSPLSGSAPGTLGRLISFDALNDGFFDNGVAITPASTTNSATAIPPVTIVSAVFNPLLNQTRFQTYTAHGFTTGWNILFQNFTDTSGNWNNQQYPIVIDDTLTNVFYVLHQTAPNDTVYTTQSAQAALTKITLSAPLTTDIQTGWAVVVNGSSTKQVCATTEIDSLHFYINMYTPSGYSVSTFTYVPNNGFVTTRNLYRTGDTSGYYLVKKVPSYQTTYLDGKSFDNLGTNPDSYYMENGDTVIFVPPPIGLTSMVEHYGMLFGINGYQVQWTPAGRPDAWPAIFSVEFAYQPVALASYAGAIIVLCLDGLYRLDGNTPTQISQVKTKAENGCIAPHSVQKTHAGLIYLSQRGLMLFDGMNAECITDSRLPQGFFNGGSTLQTAIPFWWLPTLSTYNYANLANQDGILATVANGIALQNPNPIGGTIEAIRSFYHLGKYYCFWSSAVSGYDANTAVCLDLQLPGMPITTLGMKAVDVHVDDTENAFALFANAGGNAVNDALNMANFVKLQSHMQNAASGFTANAGLGVYSFGTSNSTIPFYVRTGPVALSTPVERKRFKQIECHSSANQSGSLAVRIWIDGSYTCDGISTPAEDPIKIRRVGIPQGINIGYVTDVEMAGNTFLRAVEYGWYPMASTS